MHPVSETNNMREKNMDEINTSAKSTENAAQIVTPADEENLAHGEMTDSQKKGNDNLTAVSAKQKSKPGKKLKANENKSSKKILKTPKKIMDQSTSELPEKEKKSKKKADKPITQKIIKQKDVKAVVTEKLKQKASTRRVASKIEPPLKIVNLTFLLRFHTKFGQSLYITAQHEIFGKGD